MTPYDEAVRILTEIINELTAPDRDLLTIVRKCQHICRIVSWDSQSNWFSHELNGYPSNAPLPEYRKIHGKLIWEPKSSDMDKKLWDTSKLMGEIKEEDIAEESIFINIREGLDWIIKKAKFGYKISKGQTKDYWLQSERINLHRVEVSWRAEFSRILEEIERRTFDFASKAYVQIKYSNVIGDIWNEYRKEVDAKLSRLAFGNHFNAIETAMQSENPESQRTAVFECRSLLHDLADYLWRDTRKTYEHLPGTGADDKLLVTSDKFGNRIAAYLHQKGISGKRGKFYREEAERLASSILAIISLQSEAHDKMEYQDIRSVVISTYILLGEIITRTDLKPIEQYGKPFYEESTS